LPVDLHKKSKLHELIKVSSYEANVLFQLWKDSGAGPNDKDVKIPSSVNNSNILRLKASGLITGDTETFTLTQRGKDVISTIVMGEKNAFDKTSEAKGFEQLVSEQKRKMSSGPRFAVGKKKK